MHAEWSYSLLKEEPIRKEKPHRPQLQSLQPEDDRPLWPEPAGQSRESRMTSQVTSIFIFSRIVP